VVSVTRTAKLGGAPTAFEKLVFGSARQMWPPAGRALVALNPTAYVEVVLAKVGDGVTVTPVTDVPKVMLLGSVSATAAVPSPPGYCSWLLALGAEVGGFVYCGVMVRGYEPATEGLRPSAVSVMFEPAGIPEDRRTSTWLLVPAPVVAGVADTTVAVVRVPPEGV
jgi:hypothetical protein